MKCPETKRHLDLFLDGELSVPENLKVLEHLNLCRCCADAYEGDRALRGALRSTLGAQRAPASLLSRLLGGLPVETFEPLPRRRWISFAAAAMFFFVASAMLTTAPAELPRAFAAELSTKHDETRDGFCGHAGDDCLCLCVKCCKETENPVGKFFQKQTGRDVSVQDLSGLGYRPVGAAVWDHRGAPVCWTVQRDGKGRTITHGLVSTKIAMDSKPLLVSNQSRPVVMVPMRDSGMTCVFIFDEQAECERFYGQVKSK